MMQEINLFFCEEKRNLVYPLIRLQPSMTRGVRLRFLNHRLMLGSMMSVQASLLMALSSISCPTEAADMAKRTSG